MEARIDVSEVKPDQRCTAVIKSDTKVQAVDVTAKVVKGNANLNTEAPEAKKLSFGLKLKGAAAATPLTAAPGKMQAFLLSGGPQQVSKYQNASLEVKSEGADFCSAPISVGDASSALDSDTVPCNQLLRDAVEAARNYIEKSRDTSNDLTIHEIDKNAWRTGRTFIISFLPNGDLSGRLPDTLTERDKLDLVLVAPSDATVTWTTVTCNAPPLWRNLTTSSAPTLQAEQQGETIGAPVPWYYPARGHGCENSLDVSAKVALAGCDKSPATITQSIPTQKVYDFLFGAGFGYDFGSPVEYSAQPSKASTATMPQQVLVRTSDQTGLKPIVTLSFYPFGANPNGWRIEKDTWSPFVGLDPTRISKGGYAGFNLQPFGPTFGVLLGVSMFESQKLTSPVGVQPGDPVTGAITTRNVFDSNGIGFFFGLNATTESIKQLFTLGAEAFGAGGNSAGSGGSAAGAGATH